MRLSSIFGFCGSEAAAPYPFGLWMVSTSLPSGERQKNSVVLSESSAPRHIVAYSMPKPRRIAGMCAICPNGSGM